MATKRRSQGGGRKANSEPRVQVFRDFSGCNFELSPREFTLGKEEYQEQSDLQMNYVVVQNNAGITSNKTIETRPALRTLFTAPEDNKFTGASILVKDNLYLALENGDLKRGNLSDGDYLYSVELVNNSVTPGSVDWTSFAYIDNTLIGTTRQNQIWLGNEYFLENARKVPDPNALTFSNLTPRGSLTISQTLDDDHPYRIAIAYALVNKFGPTRHSDQFTFYASTPVNEWSSEQYLDVAVNIVDPDDKYKVCAVDFYYTTGNSSTLLFAGRIGDSDGIYSWMSGTHTFSWYGYLDATNMWVAANLIAPVENYTEGAPASRVTCIDSRVYFWGSDENPQRLFIGGNSGNLYSISPGVGGGFVDVEPGTYQSVRVVTKYKTQSGASIVTMLCDSENSTKEQRFNLVENSVSLSNEQSMKSWQAEQVAGSVGCKSFDGALVCEDGLYSVSRYGIALTTMTMEYNAQIRTNYVSDAIKPAFTERDRALLKHSILLECDGILYLAFGLDDEKYDNMIFCYDIDNKAWWTITLDIDEPILKLLHIDHEDSQEGIGIITPNKVYLLPTTDYGKISPYIPNTVDVVIQTGELSTQQPQQGWFYLSQMEFRFDYFIGSVLVELTGIDQFGRKVSTKKEFTHDTMVYNEAEWMRVDLRLQSYQIRITGNAKFRLTHFLAKLYTMSAKQSLVWGFDDSQSFRTEGDIHPTFLSYNDIKKAVIP